MPVPGTSVVHVLVVYQGGYTWVVYRVVYPGGGIPSLLYSGRIPFLVPSDTLRTDINDSYCLSGILRTDINDGFSLSGTLRTDINDIKPQPLGTLRTDINDSL